MRVVPISITVAVLLAISPALRAQTTVAAGDQVRLRIDAEHRTDPEVRMPIAKVRITFLNGPASLRSVTREVSLPFSFAVAGDRLEVTIEPLGASDVTTVRVQAQHAKVLSEGTVTGRGAHVDVRGGSIILGTSSVPGKLKVMRYF